MRNELVALNEISRTLYKILESQQTVIKLLTNIAEIELQSPYISAEYFDYKTAQLKNIKDIQAGNTE